MLHIFEGNMQHAFLQDMVQLGSNTCLYTRCSPLLSRPALALVAGSVLNQECVLVSLVPCLVTSFGLYMD